MQHKTEGIVLRTLKYQDNKLITTIYTRNFGLKSFIIRAYRTARGARKHSYFQPLSIIELVFFEKPGRDLHNITETEIALMLHSIQSEPIKLSLGLAMVELFYDTVKTEEPEPALYDFFKQSILAIDREEENLVHIFIYFLLKLSGFLGFMPQDKSEGEPVRFNFKEGIFHKVPRQEERISPLLRQFLQSDIQTCQSIKFNREEKRKMIQLLFAFYQQHIQGFKYPQTLKVFAEVFG